MTEKLYYKDSYLKEFKANLIDYKEKEENFHLILDKTAFYPEGGGQPADRGFIGEVTVKYVYEKDGDIFHVVDKLPSKKENISCKIDWQRRYDFMQQHTGQHLLSVLFEKMADAKTIGFHLGENEVTIDLDKELSESKIEKVENKVNEIIYENKNITAKFPDEKELDKIELRKDPKVNENIRVVIIDDYDLCACGGTHLKSTAEIGILKVTEFENYKGGKRVHFVAGKRAFKDYKFKNKTILKARRQLGVQNKEINKTIKRLKEELDEQNTEIEDLKEKLIEYRVKERISKGEKLGDYYLISGEINDLNPQNLKLMANKIINYDNKIVIFAQKKDETVRLMMGKSANIEKFDMNEMIGEVMKVLGGNGGGHEFFAQGGGSKPENFKKAIKKAKELLKREM
ncbi:MAG: alanyl-tRNA editing protein [Bacillota bacterium]